MTCQELWEQASDYLDGVIDTATAARIRRHAAGCDICRAELDAVTRTLARFEGESGPSADRARRAHGARQLRAELELDRDQPEADPHTLPPMQTAAPD